MVNIWPWSRIRALSEFIDSVQQSLSNEQLVARELETELANERFAKERAEMLQRVAERDSERALAELHLVQQDLRNLVATVSGHIGPRAEPLEFNRDPFEEDSKLPTQWLTDDSVPDIAALEETLSGESEAS